MIDSEHFDDRDPGAILLLVLAVAIVLSLVVLALASFVAADLRYTRVIDSRAKTLSSAESGIEYAVDRLRLNQTLCATEAAAGSPVSLNGSDVTPVGTPLPAGLNATNTKITCERVDDAIADVAGWAVVLTNFGEPPPTDQIQVDMDDHVHLYGPVFLPDPTRTNTDNNSRVEVVQGDVWYTKASCASPYSNTTLATAEHIDIVPASARGGLCTTKTSGPLFSAPDIQDPLPTNIVPDVSVPANGLADGDDTDPTCRVFSPGRYDLVPDLAGASNVYFKSGDYHFNFDIEWQIAGDNVWAGYPDAASVGTLGACNAAAAADMAGGFYGGRPGATFYLDGESRIWLGSGAELEIFPREQGTHVVSIYALSTSWQVNDPCSCYRSLLRTLPSSGAELAVHGLVWAPRGRINIDNGTTGADQLLLGGVVLQTMWLLHLDHDSFEVRPATSTVDTRIRLVSTSTAVDGVTTTVEAIVQYRPQAPNPDQRVAVSSFRVVD